MARRRTFLKFSRFPCLLVVSAYSPDFTQISACFLSLRERSAHAKTEKWAHFNTTQQQNNFGWKNCGSYFILIPASLVKCCVKFSSFIITVVVPSRCCRVVLGVATVWTLNFCHWQKKIFRFSRISQPHIKDRSGRLHLASELKRKT